MIGQVASNMRRVLIETLRGETYTASSKARADATQIFASLGFDTAPIIASESQRMFDLLQDVPLLYGQLKDVLRTLGHGDVLAFQYPWDSLKFSFAKTIRTCAQRQDFKTIVLIHDLNLLRTPSAAGELYYSRFVREQSFINCFDAVVCHNDSMQRYLVSQGMSPEKIVTLGVFDYLLEGSVSRPHFDSSVVIAGNLSPEKAPYVLQLGALDPHAYRIDLYGSGYEGQHALRNIVYRGMFPPDEPCGKLHGGFGLVWDGDSIEGCTGHFGAYQRFNNPHKLSLYLACGLPVIVWDEAAIADFVIKNGLGFTVKSLYELEDFFASLTQEQYEEYARHVKDVSVRIRKGDYLKRAIKTAIRI